MSTIEILLTIIVAAILFKPVMYVTIMIGILLIDTINSLLDPEWWKKLWKNW